MSSRPAAPATGSSLLLRLTPLLLPLLLVSLDGAEGASFRDHRLREPPREPPHRGPDQDMLKALRHIEKLRPHSGGPPPRGAPGYAGGLLDNGQALRGPGGGEEEERPGWQRQGGAEGEGEEEWEGQENQGEQGDKTQEWFQAALRALERAGPANTAHRPAGGRGPGPRLGERASPEASRIIDGENGEGEEGTHEGQEAAGEEGVGGELGMPLVRRTGEGVGGEDTLQKLATLQSIFDEVERLATGGEGEEEEGQQQEELNTRSLAYDEVARGLVDWAPLRRGGEDEVEEEEEEEEEQRGSKPQADQVLDYSDNGEDEDHGVEEEEQDGEGLSARRSTNPHPTDDAEDMANLVDYYLLKVLEKTEEEDKREIKEEEERAERKFSQFQYWDNRSPQQDMHQLLRLSQKYQIPPEELLALFQAGDRSRPRSHTMPPQSRGLARWHNRNTQKQLSLGPKQNYRYLTPQRQSRDKAKDARTLEILSLLGLGSAGGLKRPPPYQVSQPRLQPQPRRQEKYTPSQSRGAPTKLKEEYHSVGEDELAAYLAAKVLAQYPATPLYNQKTGQKRSALGSVSPDEDEEQGGLASLEQGGLASLEQAMQDYFDQMDSDRAAQRQQNRQWEWEGLGGAAQEHGLDDDALMKMMTLLTPEGQPSQEK